MKSLLYLLALMMFLGLGMMIWSSYKALRVAQESTETAPSTGTPAGAGRRSAQGAANPEVSRYITVSYLGLTMFIVSAVGAIFAAFKVMTRRF